MAEPLRPAATKTHGRSNWILVFTYANIAALTALEVNNAASLDVTRILFASSGKPTQTTNRVSAERRMGDTEVFEFIGDTSVTGGDILYAFADQLAVGSDGKKLFEVIPAGTTAALVWRRGIPRATAAAAGQFYHAMPVEFGPSFPAEAGDAESSEAAMSATVAVTGPVAISKALA